MGAEWFLSKQCEVYCFPCLSGPSLSLKDGFLWPVACPEPCVQACNQPCVTSCGDSRAVVYAPPVIVTFPGPILSTCPQESLVGTVFTPGAVSASLGSLNLLPCSSSFFPLRVTMLPCSWS
uniref:Keratin n=1 Tax=Crocodylus porosus TaxID=8502 RepID=A0A7M4F602_CROPO